MNERNLEKLTKQELINIIQNIKSGVPKSGPRRPIPTPRRSVRQMVQDYEQKVVPPVPAPRTRRPVPAPRTRITVQA